VGAIVAANADDQGLLVAQVTAAGLGVLVAVADESSLRGAIAAARPGFWVATGGEPVAACAFARVAGEARCPVMVLIEGWDAAFRTLHLTHGGALLRVPLAGSTFRAALAAAREGLTVATPGLSPAISENLPAQRLSPREREILAVAAAGASTKTIARRLELSPNTVKFHLQAAFEKLGAATRTEAVVIAIRRGELSI